MIILIPLLFNNIKATIINQMFLFILFIILCFSQIPKIQNELALKHEHISNINKFVNEKECLKKEIENKNIEIGRLFNLSEIGLSLLDIQNKGYFEYSQAYHYNEDFEIKDLLVYNNNKVRHSEFIDNLLKKISIETETISGNCGFIKYIYLKQQKQFDTIINKSPDFQDKTAWVGNVNYDVNDNSVIVGPSNNNILFQCMPIDELTMYKVSAEILSVTEDAQARLQINWHDKEEKFISSSIDVVTPDKFFREYHKIFITPKNAKIGCAYVAPHKDKDIVKYKFVKVEK